MNPGATCRERANTVMSSSVLSAIRRRQRNAESVDAKYSLKSHQVLIYLAKLRLFLLSENGRKDVFAQKGELMQPQAEVVEREILRSTRP